MKLTMEVEDRKGMLAAVSAKIADINTNIKNMEARTGDDQHARIDVTIEISDLKHLEKVIKSLRGSGRRAGSRAGGSGGGGRARPGLSVTAMTSISTRASFGRRATCTVARAGYGSREVASVDLVHRRRSRSCPRERPSCAPRRRRSARRL